MTKPFGGTGLPSRWTLASAGTKAPRSAGGPPCQSSAASERPVRRLAWMRLTFMRLPFPSPARAVPVPVAQVSMMSREAATLAAMRAPRGEAATAMTSERTPSGTPSTSSDQWPALRRATNPRASR